MNGAFFLPNHSATVNRTGSRSHGHFSDTVIIFSPTDTYRCEVEGTEEGSYGLEQLIFTEGKCRRIGILVADGDRPSQSDK